jgi:hypothetical protein
MKEDVTKRERGRVERVPIAIDDPSPVVRTDEVTDIHVGNRVAIDLVGVPKCVAEGDQGRKRAVCGPQTSQPVLKRVRFRGGICHCGAFILYVFHHRRDKKC